jgi:hypothetical protein
VRTPVSPYVHRPVDGAFHSAPRFNPAFPPQEVGKGWPIWVLEHRGHELYFASPLEMAHVASILRHKILPDPRDLGAEYGAVNSHWLSRMDKAWLSWKMRREVVKRLGGAISP